MKSKSLLFIGIILLIAGVLIKKIWLVNTLGLTLIGTGVLCKTVYIVGKYRSGEYKPGVELVFLVLGLALFFTGLYLKKSNAPIISPAYFMVTGILLKVLFVVKFVQNVRRTKKIIQ